VKKATYYFFLEYWYLITEPLVWLLAVMSVCGMVGTSLFYLIKKDPARRYGLISKFTLQVLKVLALLVILSFFFWLNQQFKDIIRLYGAWFIIRFAVSGFICGFLYYVAKILIEVSVARFIKTILHHLRYSPRVSSKGNQMRLLSEEDEDVYLTSGMQAEELVRSIDYDVWMDDISGEIRIEQYPGTSLQEACPVCGYHTLVIVKESIVSLPTLGQKGQLVKIYKCRYCQHSNRKFFNYTTSVEPNNPSQ
jgi:hypothetical protein